MSSHGFGRLDDAFGRGAALVDAMATTLADSFLADLDDLSDEDNDERGMIDASGAQTTTRVDDDDDDAKTRLLRADKVDELATLMHTERYKRITRDVDEALAKMASKAAKGAEDERVGVVDESAYKLVVECNALTVEVDNDIAVVHQFIRDKYRAKFPELESLVLHPIDYARVVKAIGNEMDMTNVELDGVLPSATIMVVSVTGSTTNGEPLSENDLNKTLAACERAFELDAAKQKMFNYVASRMAHTAPNLENARV
jgi:U4/U6 small nuclear ribonucleoprotein PRP31